MYCWVYGTLKKGNSNSYHLKDCEFIDYAEFTGNHTMFTLLQQSQGGLFKQFPALIKTEQIENTIQGEIYKIDDNILRQLDKLEGNGDLYQREVVEINGKDCIIYYFISRHEGLVLMENEF